MAGKTALQKFCIAAVLIVILLGASTAYFNFLIKQKQQARLAPDKIITFSGIPADTTLTATLSMGGKTEDLINDAKSLSLTPEQKEDFKLPYILKATLKTDKNEYRDISWKIDKRGAEYYILADGFSPEDKITLI